jgi:hypothetical protein
LQLIQLNDIGTRIPIWHNDGTALYIGTGTYWNVRPDACCSLLCTYHVSVSMIPKLFISGQGVNAWRVVYVGWHRLCTV